MAKDTLFSGLENRSFDIYSIRCLVGYLAPIAGAPLTSFIQGIIEIIIGIIFYKNLTGTSIKLNQSNEI